MANVAIIVGPEYEDSELSSPLAALRAREHVVTIISSESGATISGKNGDHSVETDAVPGDLEPSAFDAMVIPGGKSPANLRGDIAIVNWVRRFALSGKPVAAICHGPQLLAEAGVLDGKRVTGWPGIEEELVDAGAIFVDAEVVRCGALITSRKPADLHAFNMALLSVLPIA